MYGTSANHLELLARLQMRERRTDAWTRRRPRSARTIAAQRSRRVIDALGR
jgi:hypothetical protein